MKCVRACLVVVRLEKHTLLRTRRDKIIKQVSSCVCLFFCISFSSFSFSSSSSSSSESFSSLHSNSNNNNNSDNVNARNEIATGRIVKEKAGREREREREEKKTFLVPSMPLSILVFINAYNKLLKKKSKRERKSSCIIRPI